MKYTRVSPEIRNGATVYKSFDCDGCGFKIYSVAEEVWKRGYLHFHAICKANLEAKEKKCTTRTSS